MTETASFRRTIRVGIITTLVFGLLLFGKDLNHQLIHDDIGILLYFDPGHNISWWQSFLPLNNGFFRPATILLFKVLYELAGTTAWPYRLVSLLIHIAVCVLALVLACRISAGRPTPKRIDLLPVASLGTLVMAGSFPVVYLLSNSCDSLLAVGTLTALYAWINWLENARWQSLALTLAGIAIAILSKETSIVLGFVLTATAFAWLPRWPRRVWIATIGFIALSILQVAWVVWLQKQSDSSYTSTGARDLHPGRAFERLLLYLASAVWAPAYTVQSTPATAVFRLWGAGLAGLVLLGSTLLVITRRGTLTARLAVLVVVAAAFLAPVSILRQEFPMTRFAYVPSALLMVTLAVGVHHVTIKHGKKIAPVVAVGLFAFLWGQVHMIQKSQTLNDFRHISREWANFVSEVRRLSPQWPPMSYVVVWSGPEFGSYPLATNYGGTLFRVYFPGMLANFYGNEVPPEATMAFNFDGHRLTPAELKK